MLLKIIKVMIQKQYNINKHAIDKTESCFKYPHISKFIYFCF